MPPSSVLPPFLTSIPSSFMPLVLKDISKSIVAIITKEGAHHVDLRWSSKEDPEWLREVRKREVNILSKWLSQYYQSLTEIY
ncbi:hypothetical protein K7X08_014148 [Anisodus acutangulus]|uniref:Uncharacterized protein n=1 Tax=Anisodus acutangulus TaxID=402998 RepID=A0A9Q1R238_9SOLA|nr:hypothetical protein K7X08_014148 [Anisodus acutangulus]